MTITAQALGLAEPLRDAPGAPGRKVPGYTGQGWSTHETMLVVRWLFAHSDVWDQAMDLARDPLSNPHTVADTLHEKLVPRSELDVIAAQGFDPAKVNWLEIAHELIERRADPEPQEHATITEQALAFASADVTVAPEAMQPPGLPVPDDPAAISIFTAHRTDEILHKLSHASERMTAARSASGDLRRYHAARLAGHLKAALDAGHDLAANIRGHYPAEAAELEQVKESVGLAKAVSDNAKAATAAHLLETTLHELTHGSRHARQMTEDTPDDEWEFNADHAAKHLGGATEHAGKLRQHLADNYPAESRWLEGLDEVTADAEDGGGKQHARYAKGDGGTITAQMANGETISGQAIDLVGPHGYIHGWIFVGIPGEGDEVYHPGHGRGTVTASGGNRVSVSFENGHSADFPVRSGQGPGHFEQMTDDELAAEYNRSEGSRAAAAMNEAAKRDQRDDDAQAQAKAQRISALYAEQPKTEADRSRVYQSLVNEGEDPEGAWAHAHGTNPKAMQKQSVIADLRAQGYKGAGFDSLTRDAFKDEIRRRTISAEGATNGYMLGPAGKKAGIDPWSLFTGPESRARKYASPELKEWFDQNGRPTVADFQASLMGQKAGMKPADFYASVTWDDIAEVIELTAERAGETITGQMGDTLDLSPVTFDRRLISDDLIRDLGGDPEAQGLS